MDPNAAYALGTADERNRRTALIAEPRIAPLMNCLDQVRRAMGDGYDMPAFDPLDGGIDDSVA